MILTPQEAIELTKDVTKIKDSWFSTNLDTVVGGKRPEGMLKDKEYLSLREQVRFFNGDMSTLLDQNNFYWLKDRPLEKIEFFKKELMRYRPGSSEDLSQLKTVLTESKEGFIYITQHRFKDLRQFDWKKQFP
jgi:hypothetical protein